LTHDRRNTAGAVVLAYNLPGVSSQLNLTPEAIAGIFLGTVVALPTAPVHLDAAPRGRPAGPGRKLTSPSRMPTEES